MALAGLTIVSSGDPVKDGNTPMKQTQDTSLEKKEFKKLFSHPSASEDQKRFGEDHPYSKALGFTLWKTPGTTLYEVTKAVDLIDQEVKNQVILNLDPDYNTGLEKFNKLGKEKQKKLLKDMKDKVIHLSLNERLQLKTYTPKEYEKVRLSPRLGIENAAGIEGGSAVLFSIRDSFSYYNLNQEGFSFDYNSSNGQDSLKLRGAVTLDVYPDSLYNQPWKKDSWFVRNMYRFSLRTGVEFDRDDTATKPTDRTSLYLLGNFQANPDQDAHLFGVDDFFQITSPQFVQIGGALDHDSLTGTDDFRFILNWQPRFYLLKDIEVLGRTFGGRTLGINHVMRYAKGDWFNFRFHKPKIEAEDPSELSPLQVEDNRSSPSAWYSYVPADIKLAGVTDAMKSLSKGNADLSDVNLEWKAGLVFGNSDYHYRFGYLAEGVSPLSDLGESHIGHTLFAELALGNVTGEFSNAQRKGAESVESTSLTDGDFGTATIFAKYRFGEYAPTFKNVDEFQVGTRIRF